MSGTEPKAASEETPAADVRFVIDSHATMPISPLIYGVNSYDQSWGGALPPANLTLSRMGGNRLSAYNWENNASNAGNDWHYSNDGYLGGGEVPGEAVRQRVRGAVDRGAGIIVTVPMLGYVAADKDGPVGIEEATLATRLAARFRESRPRKGTAFSMSPDPADPYVYQDEFAWWLNRSFPGLSRDPLRPMLYSLDNEPDLWQSTHEEIRSRIDGERNRLTYDELVQKTITHASAIKDVVPEARILGPSLSGWSGITALGRRTPDPVAGTTNFVEYYLSRMAEAERIQGRRLVDVLDVHWYSEVRIAGARVNDDLAAQTPELVQARLQSPRSLWDPTYVEQSWVAETTRGPIRLLPRLREMIAKHYPGTRIAITEYFYGRAGDISGGVTQADVLGIFGREGVYAATLWPLAPLKHYGGSGAKAYAYAFGAFKMYRDYDGAGSGFGDTGISATTSDVERTSVYASMDAGRPDRVVIVAINKSERPLTAAMSLTHSRRLTRAEVYTLTDGSPEPTRRADVDLPQSDALTYTMPPLSVSTLVLR